MICVTNNCCGGVSLFSVFNRIATGCGSHVSKWSCVVSVFVSGSWQMMQLSRLFNSLRHDDTGLDVLERRGALAWSGDVNGISGWFDLVAIIIQQWASIASSNLLAVFWLQQ